MLRRSRCVQIFFKQSLATHSMLIQTFSVLALQLSEETWSTQVGHVWMYGHTSNKSKNQPGKVANPARGQLNREMNISLSAFAPENLVSRDGFGSPVTRQPAHLHTQAE